MVFVNKRLSFSQFMMVFVVCFLVLPLSRVSAETGETRYVSDYLLINLKTSPKPPFSTVTRIETGDALEILDENDNYYKVKTSEEQIGWVAKRYTTSETPKAIIIKKLTQKIADLESSDKAGFVKLNTENSKLQDELSKAEAKITQLSTQLQSLERLNESLKTIDPVKFEAMKKLAADMQNQSSQQQETILMLEEDNRKLQNKWKLYWFAAGACVLLLGIIIGKIPSKKQKKSLSF